VLAHRRAPAPQLMRVLYRPLGSAARITLGVLVCLVIAGSWTGVVESSEPNRDTAPVMRAVIDHFAQHQPRSNRLACVGIDERPLEEILRAPAAVDPPTELLRAFALKGVRVEPASACTDDDTHGFRLRGRRQPGGFILTFGRLKWLTPDRVEVPLRYCCWVGWGTAEVHRSAGAWRVAQLKSWAQS
jgi:hypothetical protein